MRHLLLLLPLAVACGGAEDTDAGEDPAEHACEVVADAGTALTGGAAMDETAPLIEIGEVPYTVGVDSAAPVFVRLEVDEETEALLWTDTADVVAALYLDGVPVSLPTPSPNELCGEDIPEHFEVDLTPGTWHLELGPAAVDSVWILVDAAEGHAH